MPGADDENVRSPATLSIAAPAFGSGSNRSDRPHPPATVASRPPF